MNDFSILWLRVAAALYLVGLADALLILLRRRSSLFRFSLVAIQAAVIFQFVSIVEHTQIVGHLPVGNFFDTASLASFMFALVFLAVHWRYKFVGLGLFVLPLIAVLSVAAAMGAPLAPWASRQIRDVWLLVHIVLVLVGYSALLLSAGTAVFYLLQERRLKRKSPSFFGFLDSERVPPLATLDTMITHSMSVGFAAITLAVIAGSTWASIEMGVKWIREPKIVVSLVTWSFYLLMLCLRIAAGWRGRKAAFLALTVLGFCGLTWAAHVGLRPLIAR